MPRLGGCFGKRNKSKISGQQSQRSANNLENELGDGFEVGDEIGFKWLSSNEFIKENCPIYLQIDPTKHHFWNVERFNDEPLWSFSVKSGDKKLYVTYNEIDDQVKLEQYDDVESHCKDGKGRLFMLFLQVDGKMKFRAHNSQYDRYLIKSDEGVLKMKTTQHPTEDMGWFISPSFEIVGSEPAKLYVEVRNGTVSKKWLSLGPMLNLPVQQVQTSALQSWQIVRLAGSILAYIFKSGLYHVNSALHFDNSKACLPFFVQAAGIGVKLYSPSDTSLWIVGREDDGDLEYGIESMATVWEIPFVAFEFQKPDGTTIMLGNPISQS